MERLDACACLGLRGRRVGQTGGEILLAHVYHNEEKRCHGLLPVSLLFRLVPPLQPVVVEPYPVRGVWFPSCLLLERTCHIKNIGP
jgi:hypothetical protein